MFGKISRFRFKICSTISRFRIKISADGPAQRRGGSANGKSARTIKKSFLKIYTFDAAKTVRIVLAIQSHPVFGPGPPSLQRRADDVRTQILTRKIAAETRRRRSHAVFNAQNCCRDAQTTFARSFWRAKSL